MSHDQSTPDVLASTAPSAALLHCRRFNIVDGMLLIASVAPGLVTMPESFPYLSRVLRRVPSGVFWGWDSFVDVMFTQRVAARLVSALLSVVLGCLVFPCPVQLLIRMRRPRPPLDRVALQPGTLACVVGSVGLVVALSVASFRASWGGYALPAIGASIGSAWLVLAWTGRWHREPGWIERLGIGLGVAWIVVAALATVLVTAA